MDHMMNACQIDSMTDPVALCAQWLQEARSRGIAEHNAIALATAAQDELPNVRMVLLKQVNNNAFVFFTNYGSVKAGEIRDGKGVAFVMYWAELKVQIRVRGIVSKADEHISDQYFASRSLLSRYGAIASPQSEEIASRDVLLETVESVANEFGDNPPRPDFWGGFIITPLQIEFWQEGEGRLHTRYKWQRPRGELTWRMSMLAP